MNAEPWIVPAIVAACGAAAGLRLALRASKLDSSAAVEAEGVHADLSFAHSTTLEALRALEMEKGKLDQADYTRERASLLKHGAAAMRQLDAHAGLVPPGDPMQDKSLRDALDAQREALGEARFAAIESILDGKATTLGGQAAAEPVPVQTGGARLSPRWEGAAYVLGFFLVAGGVYYAVQEAEQPAATMGAGGAAATAQPTAEVLAWRQTLETEPNNLEALNGLTFYELHKEGPSDAAKLNATALAAHPDDADALTYKALIAFRSGDPMGGSQLLDQVIGANPKHGLSREIKGISLIEIGRFDEAIAVLQESLAVGDPSSAMRIRRAMNFAKDQVEAATPGVVLVQATVSLAEGVSADFPPGAVLYATIKSPGGGPPAVAKKLPAGPFPMQVTLTDKDKIPMMGDRPIPEPFEFKLRVDFDGAPMTKDPAEPQVQLSDMSASDTPLTLTLDLKKGE